MSLLLVVAVAGCSSGSAKPTGASPAALPQVTGPVGEAAKIVLPSGPAPAKLETKVLVAGAGTPLASGELAAVNYTVLNWTGAKALGNSYSSDGGKTPNQPQVVALGSGSMLSAWNSALIGAKVGSRIEVVAPPSSTFGSQGNAQAGVAPTDVLVFVLDVVSGYKADVDITGRQGPQSDAALPKVAGDPGSGNPTVTIPVGVSPPASLVADRLIKGSGKTVLKGQTLVLQYTGVDWNTGKTFDSSFTRKQAFGTAIGVGKVIPGWDTGLVGKQVGDRVLLVVPPAQGYGPSGGQASAGIGKDDTLVFVVDIVDAL